MAADEPWSLADATQKIREVAGHDKFTITLAEHARQRMFDRDLPMGDIRYVLKNGFVFSSPSPATQPGLWKYAIETRSPNSGNRVVRLIVIPDVSRIWIKVVTVMWADD